MLCHYAMALMDIVPHAPMRKLSCTSSGNLKSINGGITVQMEAYSGIQAVTTSYLDVFTDDGTCTISSMSCKLCANNTFTNYDCPDYLLTDTGIASQI